MEYQKEIKDYIELEKMILSQMDIEAVNEALKALESAFLEEKSIYIFGNGGSSATASHFLNDFNKGISEYTDKKFRFICLNDNIPTVFAIANDRGFQEVFRFQLEGRLNPQDIVIAISGSGNSPNIVLAAEYAKACGSKLIGLTGFNGGRLKELCDISLHVPVNSMQITEDIHMVLDHLMMSIFYRKYGKKEHLTNIENE